MARMRMQGVANDSLVPTPPTGKASLFYNLTDRAYKSKLDDGSVVVLSTSQEAVEDIVANLFQDSATINVIYNDAGNAISLEVIQSALDISQIPNVPTGNLAATNVQDALNELQSDVDTRATQDDLTAHEASVTGIHGVAGDIVGTTDIQNLTNKSINADDNNISELEVDNLKDGVLNTDSSLLDASNTQIPSALAVKTYVDNVVDLQNEASEITYDNSTSDLVSTNVQDAIDEVESHADSIQTALANHIIDTIDAHDASSISVTATGNLAATNVQDGLEELQSDINEINTNAAEVAQDAVASSIADGTQDGISIAYNDLANSLNFTNTDKGSDAVTSHEGEADPHPQYLKESDNLLVNPQIVRVKISNAGVGEFTSLTDALASITDADPQTKPYVVILGAGVHTVNNPVNIPTGVSLRGEGINVTTIEPIDPDEHLLIPNTMCEIAFVNLRGISGSLGSGKSAIFCEDVGDFVQVHKVSIYGFDIGVNNIATAGDSTVYLEYVDINGDYSYALKNLGENGFIAFCQAENFYTYESTSLIKTSVKSEGLGSELFLHTVGLIGGAGSKGVIVNNGGYASIAGSFIDNHGDAGVITENIGAAPHVEITGTSFKDCALNLDIQHIGTIGFFIGYSPNSLNEIAPAATFFIANKDSKIVNVSKKGGDFTSIVSALNYINLQTDPPSSMNQWIIRCGPGTFVENQIVGIQFVTIIGQSTIIQANDPTIPLILGAAGFTLDNLTIGGVTDPGVGTIYYESNGNSIGDIFTANNIQFSDTDTLVHINGSVYPTVALMNNPLCGGNPTFDVGFKCEDTGAGFTQLTLVNLLYQRFSAPYPSRLLYATGSGSEINLLSAGARNDSPNGHFIHIQDSAIVRANSCLISGYEKAFHVANIGGAPTIQLSDIITDNISDFAIHVEHPGTLGSIAGSFDSSKVSVNDSSIVSLSYSDPISGGFVGVGAFKIGSKQSNITDVTDLIQLSSPSGRLSGGVISSSVNPLDVSISSGFGYLMDSVLLKLKKVSWSTSIITLPDNSNNYIYINNSGIVTSSTSVPSLTETVLLGRVRTAAGAIVFKAVIPVDASNAATNLDEFLRTALGAIYVSGSIVTENLGTPRHIDVSSGQYWFSRLKFSPVGATDLTFKDFYHVSGILTETNNNEVNNQYYDDNTDLIPLTTGYYVKHALYIAGDGSDEIYALVRGQAEYATLLQAQEGDLPTPPPFFGDITAPLAAIIMQEGVNSIADIINIRPRVGFQSPSTSGAALHGSLLGLSSDDHTQYLLVNGTRPMSGNLNMGGNAITNVGNVDGVDVSSHKSRHDFGGSDGFTKGTPAELTDSTNVQGTDNSAFAAGNHSHSHGNRGGGTLHAAATTSVNGFMSAADKTKLDGIEAGATADQNAAEVPFTPSGTIAATNVSSALNELDSEKQAISEKAQANGYASLDGSGKVPLAQLPDTVVGSVDYKGTWNASTNTPNLVSATPDKGDYYVINVAGSTSLGGITNWQIGDWAIYNGTSWEKVDNTDQVASVFGRQGTVIAQSGDYTASQITNTPSGGIAATNVQAALNELDTDKANLVGNNNFTGGTQTLTPTLSTDNALVATQGRVLIGSSTPQDITGSSAFPPLQILGTNATQMVVAQYSNDINPPVVNLLKSRGALNAQGLAADGDDIGRLQFRASDGVNFQAAASVRGAVDGTPSAGSMPGRLQFFTTPTGSIAPVEHARITQAGNFLVGGTTPNASAKMQIDSTTQGFLQPRMTTAQRIAITSPAEGLQVYDTDLSTVCRYSGTGWFYEFTMANTAVQSSTSATYADLTEFITPTLYPGNYIIEFEGTYQSTATGTGIGVRLAQGSATISFISINWKFSQAGNGTDKYFEYSQTALADNVTSAATLATNTNYPVVCSGVFSVSVAGTVTLQIRTETGGVGVSIRPTSILNIRKI